ncbi:MAG: glucose-dehydrogenase [Gammaproteobacteria bacterium]|nr:glucose-dehydrogenase [Gammaproteobacteria bacterium]
MEDQPNTRREDASPGGSTVCLVTGGARGIGAAVARAAGRRGYAVCVNFLSGAQQAMAVVEEIERNGGTAMSYQADISRESEVAELFAAIDRQLGPLSRLVNNAGIPGLRQPIEDIDASQFHRILDVNLVGTFLCTKEAVRRMAKSRGGAGGAIVNLSSTVTRTGGYRLSPYVAAKAGIEGLTKALSRELAPDNIRINALSPGIIATEQQPLQDAEWSARTAASIPLGRLGTPREIANAVLWLLSDESSYITGSVLEAAGGR